MRTRPKAARPTGKRHAVSVPCHTCRVPQLPAHLTDGKCAACALQLPLFGGAA